MAAQLESVEEGAGEAYSRMIRAARTALEVGTGAFIDRNFATLAEFVNPLRFLPLLPRLHLRVPPEDPELCVVAGFDLHRDI